MTDPLHRMFTAVPRRYDRVNRIVTLGFDQGWRRRAADICLERGPGRNLDLCTGTGDMAVILAKRAGQDAEIVAGDFVEPMLKAAEAKAVASGVDHRIRCERVDAADLPFEDGAFDALIIAFGFRNLTYKNPRVEDHLKEIHRVIAPGGRAVIVESSQPGNPAVRLGFRIFLKAFVGPVGSLLSGERGPYRYLSASIGNYYDADGVADIFRGAGFDDVGYELLMWGAAAIHRADKGDPTPPLGQEHPREG